MSFGNRIAIKREQRGWSQRELARLSGVHHTVISELERGVRDIVGSDAVRKLARTLGVSADFLLGTWEEDEVAARQVPKVRPGRRPSRVG